MARLITSPSVQLALAGPPKIVKPKPVRLVLPAAHPEQHKFITALDDDPSLRFVVAACGTKFGKTFGAASAIAKYAWNHKDHLSWWVAPTYKQSENALNLIKRLLPVELYDEQKHDMRLTLKAPDGSPHSVIEFKSADNPDNLRGFGVHFFVMDEAARCSHESFVSLWTTITQTFGRGIFASTPNGRGWFYEVYQRGVKVDENGNSLFMFGENDEFPEWRSYCLPTWANPYVRPEAIEQLRRNMPEDVFRQEVAAQFLLDSAGVFRGVTDCIRGSLQDPIPGRRYVMGVDLARLKDFSVLTVIDTLTKHVVHVDRFNQISWEVQYRRIIDTARRYNNAVAIMDSTGIGDPIVEAIKGSGVRVDPFKIGGNAAKQQLIDGLRTAIENKKISIPEIPVMIRELQNYEYTLSPTGKVQFSAPSGFKDDCVISLALAWHGADQPAWVYQYSQRRGI